MNITAYPHDRGQTATSETSDLFKGKHFVLRRFAALDSQISLHSVHQPSCTLNMACRTGTHLDQVLAPLLEAESVVKCRNLINPGEGHFHLFTDRGQSCLR